MSAASFNRRSTDKQATSDLENPCANCVNRKHIYAPLGATILVPILVLMALSVAWSVGYVGGQERSTHRPLPVQVERPRIQ